MHDSPPRAQSSIFLWRIVGWVFIRVNSRRQLRLPLRPGWRGPGTGKPPGSRPRALSLSDPTECGTRRARAPRALEC